MKKIIIASVMGLAAIAAQAADVSLSNVHDTKTNANGTRIGTTVFGTELAATHTDAANQYSLGKSFSVAAVGPVKLGVSGAVFYQDTRAGENGYGLSVGANATLPVTKNVDAFVGVERSVGQQRINAFNQTATVAGLRVKF